MNFGNRGAGIVDVMMGFVIISIISALSLQLLNDSNEQAASVRKYAMVKRTFGGAEQILINQRQCRCNLGDSSPTNPVSFPINVSSNYTFQISQISTFFDDDNCSQTLAPPAAGATADLVLASTSSSADVSFRSSEIYLSQFKILIPQMLYRASLFVVPTWGAPVIIPLLLNTSPDGSGKAVVKICGVDRAS